MDLSFPFLESSSLLPLFSLSFSNLKNVERFRKKKDCVGLAALEMDTRERERRERKNKERLVGETREEGREGGRWLSQDSRTKIP